jgi:nucleotide-binding universal stress UspA family protein
MINVSVPRHILLATDLGAGCDRALDRASQLAEEWNAELTVLNVLGAAPLPDQALAWAGGTGEEKLIDMAKRQLARDLKSVRPEVQLRVSHNKNVAEAIRQTAAEIQADLVVTGVSGKGVMGRFALGSTVDALARSLTLPLLVVRNRVHTPYRNIVLATDFSESAQRALTATAYYFPARELIVYHAHVLPMAGLTGTGSQARIPPDSAQAECAHFLSTTPLPTGQQCTTVIESGSVAAVLTDFVRRRDIDLAVIGSLGRSGILNLLLGSTAARLLEWLPCDTLLVPTR